MKMDKNNIRELLIDCMHSDEDAKLYFTQSLDNIDLLYILIEIIDEDYSEDAQISAAYWISKFDCELLEMVETKILHFQEHSYDCISGPIMLALSRINSGEGLKYLLEKRIGKTMKWEELALKEYLRFNEQKHSI